jgi:penicillin-binding protein 1C
MLVLDIESQSVAGYVGNTPTSAEHGKDVDIITAPRSTGSVLKPFLYASMLDEGLLLPHSLVKDIPTIIDGFSTENFDKRYRGAVPASKALAKSLNIPAVRMLREYGVDKFYNRLQDLKQSHINRGPGVYGLSLIIGGGESSLWDVSKAYLSMARTLKDYTQHSSQYDPQVMDRLNYVVNDDDISGDLSSKLGNLKISWSQQATVFRASSIYHTFEAMKTLNRPEGEEVWHFFNPDRDIAWKTGTSFGNRDAWAVGVTPKYVIGVWIGNADGEGRADLTGIDSAAPVLFDFFNQLPQEDWFQAPYDDMVQLQVCEESGALATTLCNPQMQWIPEVGERTSPCAYHQMVHLDASLQYRVHADCESVTNIVSKPMLVLPPVMSYYYSKYNAGYRSLPDYREDCVPKSEAVMRFINPSHNTTITRTKNIDGTPNAAIFELAHRQREKEVFWYLDKEYLGTTTGFHQFAINADPGRRLITALDEDGNQVKIYVNFQ